MGEIEQTPRAACNLVARRLTRPTVVRNIAVVTKRGRSLSPAAEAFAGLLVREFGSGR